MKIRRPAVLLILVAVMALALGLTVVQAQDATVIKIASQTPLSGPQSVLGISMSNAVRLAVEQLSGPLADMGYTVEYVPYDDQADPSVGPANAEQIVTDSAILAVIGHLNSGVAIPSSEVYNRNDLVMVSPANTNPLVTDRNYPTVNRVCGRDDLQGPTGAQFAAETLAVTSVYVLHDTTAYGEGVAEYFRDSIEGMGVTVLGFEGTEEASNFEGILNPILAQSPDLIYFGGIYSQTAIFLQQARSAGYTGLFMGPDGFDSSAFADIAGDAAIGTYYTSVAAPATVYPAAAQFIEDYTAEYGEAPQPFAAQSYDSTAVVLLGIQAAAEAAGGMPSRAQVAEAVRATTDFVGITGTITFDWRGDPVSAPYYVIEVTSGNPDDWGANTLIATLDIPSPVAAAPAIADLALASPDLSTLVEAALGADPAVVGMLAEAGPFTILAPNNDAFAALMSDMGMAALSDADAATLTAILQNHVIAGAVFSSNLEDGQTLTTIGGGTLTVGVGSDGTVTLTDAAGHTATVVAPDTLASNGVVHVIDAVLTGM
jgi:branched-chain amino acid transport system substrate-binding protein